MAKKEALSITAMNYEQAFTALEKVVNELEAQQNSLEESMKLFERGQALVKYCTSLLDEAELKLQVLSKHTGEDK